VEQWADIRRLYLVKRLSIKEIVRRTGRGRNTTGERCAPLRRRTIGGRRGRSELDPCREEIHRLLRSDPRLPGKRVRELLEEQGLRGWQDDPGRLPARAAAALPCRGRAPSSAPPIGRALCRFRPPGAGSGDPGRRRDARVARRSKWPRRSGAHRPAHAAWRSSSERARALSSFVRYYNRRRPHSSIGGRPPISRVHNAMGPTARPRTYRRLRPGSD
jgi:hypothetical protein